MNLGEVRTTVRTQLDVDDVELTDLHLDWMISDAFDATIAVEGRWPFYEHTDSLAVLADTASYPMPSAFHEISSVHGDQIRLAEISHETAEEMFGAPGDETGTPQWFSFWADEIHLWPAPQAAGTVTLRGYRPPSDWMANDVTEMDCDSKLQPAVVLYACARAYQQQEDEVLANDYFSAWQAKVASAANDIMRPTQYVPLILSGGAQSLRPRTKWGFV